MTAPAATTVTDPASMDASVFPLMPPRSIEARLAHFDETVFRADPTTVVYKLMDALVGDAGSGSLKKDIFMQRLAGALETIYFNDLDYIFGNIGVLARAESESYPWDPTQDMLTPDEWDEVRVKDAWFRARIKEFFTAVGLGGTPDGLRMACHAATSVDCDIYEVWRYKDNFGLSQSLGRAPVTVRNEVVLAPHKTALTPKEFRLLREMIKRLSPVDTVVTINLNGLAVSTPVIVKAGAADSSYFEVVKAVAPTPVLDDVPNPEVTLGDLRPTERWLFAAGINIAPCRAFNITMEYGYHYLVSGGARSPIDSVEYGTLQPDGSVRIEPDYEAFAVTGQYTAWAEYDKADSPDNYPGGKFGLHPETAPALNPDGTPYVFQFPSQQAYVDEAKVRVIAAGGQADDYRFRVPIVPESTTKKTYTADLAVAYNPPVRDSTVTSPWRDCLTAAVGYTRKVL